ncbi:uncharacterized protein LOC107046281 [Diachasma alloeum]|uniref:uncharacterized protein LOC107046281 n=1 Tax=Diachasma alloeum TaxID=454923 RepID=UPI000738493C|nr:uncharacterized protein LOC107046281 [Diachasma alloeum]
MLGVQIVKVFGAAAKLRVECLCCSDIMSQTYTSSRVDTTSQRPPFEINRRMIDGFLSCGLGHAAMKKFAVSVNTNIVQETNYKKHFTALSKQYEMMRAEVLPKSRAAVRKFYMALDPNLTDDSIIDICMSFDGSWHRRGHISLYGVAAVIDILTGIVVDYVVLSKYCHMCTVTAEELGKESPEFHFWQEEHKKMGQCSCNHEGSSGSIEVSAAEILWKRSIENCQMRYTTMLSDGDSKAWIALQKLAPYGPETPIEKDECINHVAKRLETGLKKVAQDSKKNGINIGGRAEGALKETTMVALKNYFRNGISRNFHSVENMRREILATLKHCSSTNADPNHGDCPDGPDSWCFYNKRLALGLSSGDHSQMKVKLNNAVVSAIRPLYDRLTSTELLPRCSRGGTQNTNESRHAVIWSKCPKHTISSLSKIRIAITTAVAEFNMGFYKTQKIKTSRDKHPLSSSNKGILKQKDKIRSSHRQKQKEISKKKIKRKLEARKKAAESTKKKKEGPAYAAGAF